MVFIDPEGSGYQKTMVFIDPEGCGCQKTMVFIYPSETIKTMVFIVSEGSIKTMFFIDSEGSGISNNYGFVDPGGSPPDGLGSLCNAFWWGDAFRVHSKPVS
jgi:hypothetical protein